jgi:hypothetical protein
VQYAANTTVSAEKSKAEIESTLMRYGATSFGYQTEATRAVIQFQAQERWVRFILPMPDPSDHRFTHHSRGARTPKARQEAYEQASRQHWRALALAIKAKLESVETGITSFEEEFLAHILLPDGTTFGQWATGEVERVYETSEMPRSMMLALPPGPGSTA